MLEKIGRVAFDKHTGNVFDELSHLELYTFFATHMADSYQNQNKEQTTVSLQVYKTRSLFVHMTFVMSE